MDVQAESYLHYRVGKIVRRIYPHARLEWDEDEEIEGGEVTRLLVYVDDEETAEDEVRYGQLFDALWNDAELPEDFLFTLEVRFVASESGDPRDAFDER